MSAHGSVTAKLAQICGWAALLLVVLGFVTTHFGLLTPYTGFRVFAAGLVVGSLSALIFGVIGWIRSRGHNTGGRRRALQGIVLGGLLVVAAGVMIAPHAGAPPIHDLTTNPDDPPSFVEAARHPDNAGRDLTYPHGGAKVIAEQRRAYPDLEPITLDLPPSEAFNAALRAAEKLGWTVAWANAELGTIEAYEISWAFRFVDDVAVRIRPRGSGSIVDVRSTSRVGISDLGANAARIRRFVEKLEL